MFKTYFFLNLITLTAWWIQQCCLFYVWNGLYEIRNTACSYLCTVSNFVNTTGMQCITVSFITFTYLFFFFISVFLSQEANTSLVRACWNELFTLGLAQCAHVMNLSTILAAIINHLQSSIQDGMDHRPRHHFSVGHTHITGVKKCDFFFSFSCYHNNLKHGRTTATVVFGLSLIATEKYVNYESWQIKLGIFFSLRQAFGGEGEAGDGAYLEVPGVL